MSVARKMSVADVAVSRCSSSLQIDPDVAFRSRLRRVDVDLQTGVQVGWMCCCMAHWEDQRAATACGVSASTGLHFKVDSYQSTRCQLARPLAAAHLHGF